jgi:hypothetical protein
MELTRIGAAFATVLVAAPARFMRARGRFGLKNTSQQPFHTALAIACTKGTA